MTAPRVHRGRAQRLRHAAPERLAWLWASDWSLTVLLVLLATTVFLIRPIAGFAGDVRLITSLVFTVMLVSGAVEVAKRSRLLGLSFGVVAVLTVLVHWARYTIFGTPWLAVDAISSIVAFGMLAAIVLVQVFRDGPITIQRIQGAIAVYLLIAIMFAAAYTAIDLNIPNAFQGGLQLEHIHNDPMQRFIYFSFVTLTTVGYGDVVPLAPVACSLAMLEALIGQLFPAILLARLVSMELYHRQQRRTDNEHP